MRQFLLSAVFLLIVSYNADAYNYKRPDQFVPKEIFDLIRQEATDFPNDDPTESPGETCPTYPTPTPTQSAVINSNCLTCGYKGTSAEVGKIVGGSEAPKHGIPWIASIQNSNGHFCGGSLIKPGWVVTAAHCMTGENVNDVTVVLGEHDRSGTDGNEKVMTITKITMHENYNSQTYLNDIALLKLSTDVQCSSYYNTVCLPDANTQTDPWAGNEVELAGWGHTTDGGEGSNALLKTDVHVITKRVCIDKYSESDIEDNMICAYDCDKDTCQNDSGGPMTTIKDNKRYLIGIVSWGQGCAIRGRPGVYTEVAGFLDWINQNTH